MDVAGPRVAGALGPLRLPVVLEVEVVPARPPAVPLVAPPVLCGRFVICILSFCSEKSPHNYVLQKSPKHLRDFTKNFPCFRTYQINKADYR